MENGMNEDTKKTTAMRALFEAAFDFDSKIGKTVRQITIFLTLSGIIGGVLVWLFNTFSGLIQSTAVPLLAISVYGSVNYLLYRICKDSVRFRLEGRKTDADIAMAGTTVLVLLQFFYFSPLLGKAWTLLKSAETFDSGMGFALAWFLALSIPVLIQSHSRSLLAVKTADAIAELKKSKG